MPRRLPQINKNIQKVFGEILQTNADLPPGVLVTISRVEVTENLRSATIWISVLPAEKASATLEHLQAQMYDLQGFFNRTLNTRPLPRLSFQIDSGAAHADHMNRLLNDI